MYYTRTEALAINTKYTHVWILLIKSIPEWDPSASMIIPEWFAPPDVSPQRNKR